MCDACSGPNAQLRELIVRFEALAKDETDPVAIRRLRRALDELSTLDERDGCTGCAGDIGWADDLAPAEA
jgi:hypothetical protein